MATIETKTRLIQVNESYSYLKTILDLNVHQLIELDEDISYLPVKGLSRKTTINVSNIICFYE